MRGSLRLLHSGHRDTQMNKVYSKSLSVIRSMEIERRKTIARIVNPNEVLLIR